MLRERLMNPDCRAWLAATAKTLPRTGMGEDLNTRLPTTVNTK